MSCSENLMEKFNQSGRAHGAPLAEALDGLWRRFLPEIAARVAVLESAVAALAEGDLKEEQREVAHAAAHKLAGVLGTFGLARGTSLARDLEIVFTEQDAAGDKAMPPATMPPLTAAVAELRAAVEGRNATALSDIAK